MRRSILIFILLISSVLTLSAVTHIYSGANTYSSNILYTWDGKHLYSGSNAYASSIIATFDGKHLYSGRNTYSSDILCTVNGPIPVIFFTVL